jgi:hypothetical protein
MKQLGEEGVALESIQVDHSQMLPGGARVQAAIALLTDQNNFIIGILVHRFAIFPT